MAASTPQDRGAPVSQQHWYQPRPKTQPPKSRLNNIKHFNNQARQHWNIPFWNLEENGKP